MRVVIVLGGNVLQRRGEAADPGSSAPQSDTGRQSGGATSDGTLRWRFTREGNDWRRVVASPKPQRILELAGIGRLENADRILDRRAGTGVLSQDEDVRPG